MSEEQEKQPEVMRVIPQSVLDGIIATYQNLDHPYRKVKTALDLLERLPVLQEEMAEELKNGG